MARKVTCAVLVIVAVVAIGYDIAVYLATSGSTSISSVLLSISWGHPVVPLVGGGLLAHLFWPGKTPLTPRGGCVVALVVVVLVSSAGLLLDLDVFPGIPLAAGILLGRLLVPQRPR